MKKFCQNIVQNVSESEDDFSSDYNEDSDDWPQNMSIGEMPGTSGISSRRGWKT